MAKPIGYVIDTGNSLAASLIFCTVYDQGSGNPTDLVTGASASVQGSAAWTTMDNGDPGRIFTNNGDVDYFSTFDSTGATAAMSLVIISEATNGVLGGWFFSKGDGNAGLYDLVGRQNGSNNFDAIYANLQVSDSALAASNKVFYGFAGDATSVFWNVDGSTATTAGVSFVSEQKRLVIGGRYLNPTYDLACGGNTSGKGKISAVFWWSRKLSAAELVTLQGNPWVFLMAPSSANYETRYGRRTLAGVGGGVLRRVD